MKILKIKPTTVIIITIGLLALWFVLFPPGSGYSMQIVPVKCESRKEQQIGKSPVIQNLLKEIDSYYKALESARKIVSKQQDSIIIIEQDTKLLTHE